jgi:hypothetical protein
MVHRAHGPLNIDCQKGGAQIAEQSVPSHIRPMVWGNFLFGGGIGFIVDFSDGAAHHYPQMVTVTSQMASAAGQTYSGMTTMATPAAGQSGSLASMDPRIGKPMFNAAQNVAARAQCDSAIRVLMADGQRALFEASCQAGASVKIECQQDQCTPMHGDTTSTM